MKLKWILFSFLNFFILEASYAQMNEFTHLSVNQGLSQSVTNCILQDSEGYMWFGTQDGLNKFNGYEFENYIANFKDSWILSIAEDLDSNIWIGTKKGLHKLNKKTNKINFIELKNKNLSEDAIYGLCLASSGKIVVNTPPYIHFINSKTIEIESFNTGLQQNKLTFDQNIPVIEGEKGQFWIGSAMGLSFFDYNNKESENYTFSEDKSSINSNNISALFCDSKKNIWIGSENGLNKLNAKTKKITSIFNSNTLEKEKKVFVRSIVQDKNKNFWIATNGSGLIKLSENKGLIFHNHSNIKESISHDVVLSLCIDKSENLWLGSLQAIDKTDLKAQKFKLYRKTDNFNSIDLLDNVIASIFKESEERIWIGNWGKGLNLLNRKTNEVEHFSSNMVGKNHITNDFVHAIYKFENNEIWIGNRNGIEVYNGKNGKFVLFNEYYKTRNIPNLKNIRINRIIQDKNKNIWLASHNGVYKLDFDKNRYIHFSKEYPKFRLSDNQVYSLIEDSNGFIWLASSGGLDKINPKNNKIEHFKNEGTKTNSLSDNYTIALCEDADKNLWIGTQNGVNKFLKKDSIFIHYGLEQGIPKKIVYEIEMDKFKKIWITTGKGLFFYDSKNEYFNSFELSDGLQSLEFNLNAKYQSANGELFFGGMNGFNSFFPDSLHENSYKPNLVFTSFEKKNEKENKFITISNGSEIKLNSEIIEFIIKFSALEFTNSSKNKYAYQMKGISETWIELDHRRFVPFPKLPAGKYVFSIRGSNNDGVWNKDEISLKLIILPAWWKSNWAYFSYFILAILAVYLLIIGREKKLKYERDVLERKVIERTEEINAQKEEIQKKNNNITASINYASRIQRAVLPQSEKFNEIISNNLLFFKPRDIVSGDFFWFSEVDIIRDDGVQTSVNVIIAADSTGHGVPGAFVTVIGNNILDDIVNKRKIYKPHEILYKLDEEITRIFKQKNDNISVDDGMDISIITLEKKENKIMFSGAKNPLCMIRNSEMQLIKGSRSAIGGYFAKKKVFESHEILIEKGDVFYVYSDGYQDQFGGTKNLKFMARKFRALLLDIHLKTPNEQMKILENKFNAWKLNYPQTDDIIILGLMF